jgi:hypothetical protein
MACQSTPPSGQQARKAARWQKTTEFYTFLATNGFGVPQMQMAAEARICKNYNVTRGAKSAELSKAELWGAELWGAEL